ncbi:hypothetical protein NDU88_001341 [Pleurodeles waltl]|uniref:Uncharacterized protein n=1 Tax=Pleurodeles waltl TaxID=8319 RepID=A0AAV7VZM1_PLEWA|nr:hypothetical protein NDU88_001341 [Pleurodeles waltl]
MQGQVNSAGAREEPFGSWGAAAVVLSVAGGRPCCLYIANGAPPAYMQGSIIRIPGRGSKCTGAGMPELTAPEGRVGAEPQLHLKGDLRYRRYGVPAFNPPTCGRGRCLRGISRTLAA